MRRISLLVALVVLAAPVGGAFAEDAPPPDPAPMLLFNYAGVESGVVAGGQRRLATYVPPCRPACSSRWPGPGA
jgi:hypothetical protein